MSYTKGYVAPEAGALIVDMGRMQRIVEINETDMTVTVEAGCTWHALYEALHPDGLAHAALGHTFRPLCQHRRRHEPERAILGCARRHNRAQHHLR